MQQSAILVNNICVKELYLKGNYFYYTDFNGNSGQVLANFSNLKSGFIYDKGSCYFVNNVDFINELGIYQSDYSFLMGLFSLLICFTLFILVVLTVSKIR